MSTSACRRCTKGLAYSHYVLRAVRRREETSREKVCRQPELRDTRPRHRVHSTRRKDVRVCGGQDNLYPALDTGVRNLLWVMFTWPWMQSIPRGKGTRGPTAVNVAQPDPRRDGGHNPVAGQFFHESVPEVRLHRL